MPDDSRYGRLQRGFAALADRSVEDQRAGLATLRAEDPELADELAALLELDADDMPELTLGPEVARALLDPTPRELGPYQLLERLGAGGAGEVYRARDRRTGAEVALKTLRADRMTDPGLVLRFRREFRAVSRLAHPACLRVFEEGAAGDHRYFTMELARGGDLTRLVGAPVQRVVAVLLEVCAGLDYIHAHRILHRDLKPTNVLLTHDEPPRARIADFGIALDLGDRETRLTGGYVVGTPDYLAPEQRQGLPLDPRTDLYALGCTLFELLVGEPPGWPVSEPALAALGARGDVPPALVGLLRRLLHPQPAARPSSALEVATDLAALLESGEAPAGAPGGFLFAAPVLGREAEIEALTAWATAHPAEPPARALVAPAGQGKTALLQHVAAALARAGVRVVTVSAEHRHEPFAPFAALLRALRLTVAPPEDAGQGPDALRIARRRYAARLADALGAQAAKTPTCLIVEDLHQAGDGTLALLRELLGCLGPRQNRPALLLSARPSARPALAALGVAETPVPPLGDAAVEDLIAATLGAGRDALPQGLVAGAVEYAGGRPLLVRSLLQELVASGALRRRPGGWQLRRTDAIPTLNAEVFAARLDRLGSNAREVLTAAALAGPAFDSALLCAALEQDDTAILDALGEAVAAELICSEPAAGGLDPYRFVHARYAETLKRRAPDAQQATLHRRLGRALKERGGASPGALAHHLGRTEAPEVALPILRAAADAALAARDYEAAAGHLWLAEQRLAETFATSDTAASDTAGTDIAAVREAADLSEARADVLVAVGRAAEAATVLRRLIDQPDAGEVGRPTRLRRKLGWAYLLSNETARGVDMLRAALDAGGVRVPTRRSAIRWRIVNDAVATWFHRRREPSGDPLDEQLALAHRELGFLDRWADLERSAAHMGGYLRFAERAGQPTLQAEARGWRALGLVFLGRERAAGRVVEGAQALADQVGEPLAQARLQLALGAYHFLAGRAEPSIGAFDRAIAESARSQDRFMLGHAEVARAWVVGFCRSFADAQRGFEAAADIGRQVNLQWLQAEAACGLGLAYSVRRQPERATEQARWVLEKGRALGLPAFDGLASEVLGAVAFLSDDFAAAVDHFERALSLYRAHRLTRAWGFVAHFEYTEALLWRVDRDGLDAVPDLLARLRRSADALRDDVARLPLFAAFDLVVRGTLESRRGRPDKAEALFDRALARRQEHRSVFEPWLRCRVALERRRLGGPRAALATELDGICEQLIAGGMEGMADWVERVRQTGY